MTKYFLMAFMLFFITFIPANAQDQSWIQIGNSIYGAKQDANGPIGGGRGYKNIIKKGDFTVTSLESLLDALLKVNAGQIIFIPDTTEIDLTTWIYIEKLPLKIPAGVTIAGCRGLNGSKGAILTSDVLDTRPMILVLGADVRITGLRIQGPCPKQYNDHWRRSFLSGGKGNEYYYKFPASQGIQCNYSHLEVDNCEISAFGHAGIMLYKGTGHYIHHNFIHNCQYNGLGYGIAHDSASSLIEFNLFDFNRHSIQGTGRKSCGYIARNNIQLGNALSHCFDMHGGSDRKDGTDLAGSSIEIYNNTFMAPGTTINIRGIPEEKCEIHNNWFTKYDDPVKAVKKIASEKTRVFNNAYGEKPVLKD